MPLPQPLTTARRASSSIQRQKGLLAGTSVNTGVVQSGGTYTVPPRDADEDRHLVARGLLAGQSGSAVHQVVGT